MYKSNPSDHSKSPESESGSQPPQHYGETTAITTDVPVNSTDDFYNRNSGFHFEIKPKTRVPWSTGLCDCTSDVPNCCLTCWCPCITFGKVAEIVDKGSSACGASGALYTLIACVTGCPCFYSCFYRTKMRQHYMLQETPCGDCCVHCCCEQCALCQEYRELKNQGFDMAIGWHGNMERQNRERAMIAVDPVEAMSRLA